MLYSASGLYEVTLSIIPLPRMSSGAWWFNSVSFWELALFKTATDDVMNDWSQLFMETLSTHACGNHFDSCFHSRINAFITVDLICPIDGMGGVVFQQRCNVNTVGTMKV